MIMQYAQIALIAFIGLILNVLIIKKSDLLKSISNQYNPIQKIHEGFVPPLGGVVIITCFVLYLILYQRGSFLFQWYVLIPLAMILLIGLIEDLKSTISPRVRLFIIFLGSIIFCIGNNTYPSLEIYFIGDLINNNLWIKVLFYSLCLTALANGTNMIDGMNGLAGFSLLIITICLISLSILYSNIEVEIKSLVAILVLIIIFLIFNFPWGKIFLGDAGSYGLGWLLGVHVIIIFNSSSLNTWTAVIILFYPIAEVVFSTIRKLIQKKNPMQPDLNHLHLKLYALLKGPVSRSQHFNSFTTLCLMPFWFSPVLLIMWANYYAHLAIYFLVLMVILYIAYYFAIPSKNEN